MATYGPQVPPGTGEAVCRGFADAYGLPEVFREAIALGAHLVEVPDPTAPAEQQLEQRQAWYRRWLVTGEADCADCGTTVRCENLETLPAHHCTQRQGARRAASGRAV
ncbi:hypothetical protein ACIPW5_36415 [Streptomyces sp. NPDC090077]|uniref:hypothetical protein n=1 Tax=Streptomyces sp. NPDC090077 TaxID=3365938 RepID=UPI00381A29E4